MVIERSNFGTPGTDARCRGFLESEVGCRDLATFLGGAFWVPGRSCERRANARRQGGIFDRQLNLALAPKDWMSTVVHPRTTVNN